MPHRICTATTKKGLPCRGPATSADGLRCLAHDPERSDQMKIAQAQGGSARSNANRAAKSLPDDLKDVAQMLLAAMRDVRDGKLDPKVASALASLSNAYRGIFEVGQVDAKLAEIDARLAAAEEAS